jgi:hypothetical protein
VSEFAFLPVRFIMRQRLLVPGDGLILAPATGSVISGSVIRGILAQACRGRADLLETVIVSGDIAAAPAFPVLTDDEREFCAFPAPRVLLRIPDTDRAVDGRADSAQPQDTESVRGLVGYRAGSWWPARVATTTELRLVRPRRGGTQEGLGPIAFTTLDPQQVFEARLRLRGSREHRDALRERLIGLLDTTGMPLVFGSGADGSYGGEAEVRVASLSTEPDPWPAVNTPAGAEVDLVLRAPALVAAPATGEYDPAALVHHVTELLKRLELPAHATVASTAGVRVGGAHSGYGRMRPPQWAAAPGSVITIHTTGPVSAEDWRRVLAHRIGARTVDGLGILAMLLRLDGTEVEEPLKCLDRPPGGRYLLPAGPPAAPAPLTGIAASQLDSLQERLLAAAADRWVRDAALAMVAAMPAAADLGVALLGRLRSGLHDRAALVQELTISPPATKNPQSPPATDDPARPATENPAARPAAENSRPAAEDPPWVRQLARCAVGELDLRAWLIAAASPDSGDIAWRALSPGIVESWRRELDLVLVIPSGVGTEQTAAQRISRLRDRALWNLARAVVLTIQHAAPQEQP